MSVYENDSQNLGSTQVFRKAPGPTGLELLWSIKQFRQDPLLFLLQHWRRYGDVVRIQMGSQEMFILSHPDHVGQVFKNASRYNKHTIGYDNLRMLMGRGLFTSDGNEWLKARKIAQPAFQQKHFVAFANAMVSKSEQLLADWDRLSKDQEIYLEEEMERLTIGIINQTFFSRDMSSSEAILFEKTVRQVWNYLISCSGNFFNWFKHIPTPARIGFKKSMRFLDDFACSLIQKRRASEQPYCDLLGMFMEARDSETGEGLSDLQLRDQIITMLTAGFETTANVLSWTLYLLSKHPDVLRMLQRELGEVLNGKAPQVSTVQELVYTRMVIKESMRLFPPAWVMERSNYLEEEIGGYTIPKHSRVLIATYLTHRRDDIWDNPEGFDPQRFAPEREGELPRFSYYPFGGGARKCIGEHFAMMESTIILAMILQRYELRLVPGHPVIPVAFIVMQAKNGIKMTLKRL